MPKPVLLCFYKPFQVLCQFSREGEKQTLADYIAMKNVYPAGRLDYDSEGLVLLTNDGKLQHQIADPRHKWPKTYWVQVEGRPEVQHLEHLQQGVELRDGRTRPAHARILPSPPLLPERVPPIRFRKTVPDAWIELTINEGRNRQVRRMTAAVGLPTLRLVRWSIGDFTLANLQPGRWRQENLSAGGKFVLL